MVAYNFEARFCGPVESGKKVTTIRQGRKRETRVGDRLQLYTAMRTKKCRKLADAVCVSVDEIRITEFGVKLNGDTLHSRQVGELARQDGFDSISEFKDFFRSHYGLPFYGELLRWELCK